MDMLSLPIGYSPSTTELLRFLADTISPTLMQAHLKILLVSPTLLLAVSMDSDATIATTGSPTWLDSEKPQWVQQSRMLRPIPPRLESVSVGRFSDSSWKLK